MSKYTQVYLVSLKGRFKLGTIGSEMEYVYRSILLEPMNIQDLFTEEETYLDPIKDLDMFYAFADPDEPNPDEVLRQLGMYDSTDPRSCIRRKKK